MCGFDLKITYLKNGWAELSAAAGGSDLVLFFEYVPNDPIFELLESAIKISGRIGSVLVFYNCSQRNILKVSYVNDTTCRIEADNIRADLPVKAYCRAILRMFDTYIYQYSVDDYLNNWLGFPNNELEKLRAIYHNL
ncbi:MAG: hypothetical protein FWG90_02600 [Oscillospiraceae bacterium]|nr:hypothetical protein [Oscillospiraceae bacterium]